MKLLGGISFDGQNIKLNSSGLQSMVGTDGVSPFIKIGELGKISLNPSSQGFSISFGKDK